MIVNISGYFAPVGTGGLSLYPATPSRVLETRDAQGAFHDEFTVNVVGSPCHVPSTAQAFGLNSTVVSPGLLGFLSYGPMGRTGLWCLP